MAGTRTRDRFFGFGSAYCSEIERSTGSSSPPGELGPVVTTGAVVSNGFARAAWAAAAAKGSSADGGGEGWAEAPDDAAGAGAARCGSGREALGRVTRVGVRVESESG